MTVVYSDIMHLFVRRCTVECWFRLLYTLLVRHQQEHSACKNLSDEIVICLDWDANDLNMVQQMPLSPYHLFPC